MAVNLKKGQQINLLKENAGLKKIKVLLGWDLAIGSEIVDCDAFLLVLSNGGILYNKNDIVFFGNLTHWTNAVHHMGDNVIGFVDDYDEEIWIDLEALPQEYDRLTIGVNIYQGDRKNQHFGMIENAYIKLVDGETGKPICNYDLCEDYYGKTTMLFGEVYRDRGVWKFEAVGEGTDDTSIMEFAEKYMVQSAPAPEYRNNDYYYNQNYNQGYYNNNNTQYTPSPQRNSSGCYVATAVYGSYDCPQVWTLRRYRDEVLAKTWYGRLFIHLYYRLSPPVVNRFGNTRWFTKMWRSKLDRMVKKLNMQGFSDKSYEDLDWQNQKHR